MSESESPETVREFRAWFPDDAACRAYLERIRWPNGPRCPRCEPSEVWANASQSALTPAIQGSVEPKSQVLTDGWEGYGGLVAAGYDRPVVRPSAGVGENLLPRANRVASLLQRWLLGTPQGAVAHAHLDYYLDEFVFRFNRRRARGACLSIVD